MSYPVEGAWQLSPKVVRLHQTLQESLNVRDRANFTQILDNYKRTGNIQRFVESLNRICSTPQQRQDILPLLRSFIPRKHREKFDYECSRPKSAYGRYYETYSHKQLPRTKYYHTTRSLPDDFNRWGASSVDSGFETPVAKPSSRKSETGVRGRRVKKPSIEKLVLLERDRNAGENFGFSIRGGAEHNVGLFVSSIDEGSVAEEAGLCLGDQIMEANHIDFNNISHRDAVEVLQQAATLHLLVKCVGKIPGTFKSSSSYRWIDPMGNEVSPPPQYTEANWSRNDMSKSDLRLLGGDDERKVNLFVADGAELGLRIRGGIQHGLGIFIASVDPNSGAERAGFQVGDQILDVNGKSFVDISHADAVKVLKSAQHMVITLKDTGVLPHGKKIRDETRWIKPSSADSCKKKTKGKARKIPSFHEPMGSSLLTHHSIVDHSDEILEIKARQVLSSNELRSFGFYLNEYRIAHLSLDSFLSVLSDLLETPAKTSLFREIRSSILPRDLSKFDEWMDKRADKMSKADDREKAPTKYDGQSVYSFKSSDSSTNSWLGLFENGNQQHLKSRSRERFDQLPDPPKEFLDNSWENASSGSLSGRTRRVMTTEDFPPPPIFLTEDGDTRGNDPVVIKETTLNNRTSKTKFGRTISRSDVRFDSTVATANSTSHGEDDENGLYEAVDLRNNDRSSHIHHSPKVNSYVQARTGTLEHVVHQDGLCTAEDKNYGRSSSDWSSSGVNSHTLKTISLADDEDTEDGLYTAVNNADTAGSSLGVTKSPAVFGFLSRTEQVNMNKHDEVLRRNSWTESSDNEMPIYASVDKSKKSNKSDVPRKIPLEQDSDIPPTIPERRYIDSDPAAFLERKPESVPNEDFLRNNHLKLSGENPCEPPRDNPSPGGTDSGLSERLNKTKSKSSIRGTREVNERYPVNDKNDVGSTNQLKKAKRSKTNIVQMAEQNGLDEQNKTFVVELTKHTSNLGLSITGGTDTESKEIRIKYVKGGDTVAGSCPLLKPGQIILGVDEKSLRNVTSGIAAMAIKQAFYSDKTVLKLTLENDS